MNTTRPSIRALRASGWPRWAIAHLLINNRPSYSPVWVKKQITEEATASKHRPVRPFRPSA